MPHASASIVINASPKKVFEVLTDFESYPEFLPEVTKASVEKGRGRVAVSFEVRQIRTIRYTVSFKLFPPKRLEWRLVSGDLFKKNSGAWTLQKKGKGTKAGYSLDVEFDIPVPSFIVLRLVDAGIPAMLDRFKARVESFARASANVGK